jgi:hypothetical protein
MLQLSSNGLRLVPSHLAGNFSFHSQIPLLKPFEMSPEKSIELDLDGIYVTFTLSDGDQLMMMNTAELGNWNAPERGTIPFNWEVQPLLVDLAPALLERYTSQATPNDCLIAGPSGAGYIVPPLAPNLKKYVKLTSEVCQKAGIRVVTSYVADPPSRIIKLLAKFKGEILGYLTGYAVIARAPQALTRNTVLIANEIPVAANIWDTADQVLNRVREKINNPGKLPRFIGVHLFAYRTTLQDVAKFVTGINNEHVHFVRADEYLHAAHQYLPNHKK